MAAGRISLAHGLILGFATIFLGSLYLAYTTNLLTGTLTLLTAISYVGIYTPLKRIMVVNTFIGAFPGALPPLIGWTAVRGVIEWPRWHLRHPVCVAVPALYGHRLDVSR